LATLEANPAVDPVPAGPQLFRKHGGVDEQAERHVVLHQVFARVAEVDRIPVHEFLAQVFNHLDLKAQAAGDRPRVALPQEDVIASWTCAFHAGSPYARNHWLSTTFTIAGVIQRQTTGALGSYMRSAWPFEVSSLRISSLAISTRTPANGPQFSFRTPRYKPLLYTSAFACSSFSRSP